MPTRSPRAIAPGRPRKRKGTKFGRPSALDDSEKRMIAYRHGKAETMAQLAHEHEVGEATIWRVLNAFGTGASV